MSAPPFQERKVTSVFLACVISAISVTRASSDLFRPVSLGPPPRP